MAGKTNELQARFTAQISDFKKKISGIRDEMGKIGDGADKSVSEANASFNRFKDNIGTLKTEISRASSGSSSAFKELEQAIERVEREMADTGDVGEKSLNDLRKAIQNAEQDMSNLGDDVDFNKLEQAIKSAKTDLDKLDDVDFKGLEKEADQVEKEIDDIGDSAQESTDKAGKGFNNLRDTILKVGGAVGGIALVSQGVGGLISVTGDYQTALQKTAQQTGLTETETKKLGESMKNIYNNGYGESFESIGEAMSYVQRATNLTGKELEGVTQNGLMLQEVFGYEVSESARVASTMMKNFGISGDEAYTLIAQGAQKGLDTHGDMMDTFNEYSVYFAKMGFDSEQMFNILETGAKNGTFNLDKVGDAVKELGIRVKDESKTTMTAFSDLGFNAEELTAEFGKGGESAQKAFSKVMKALSDMEDPVKRNQIGVSLFGTQFEDLEADAILALGNIEGSADKSADTLEKINEIKYTNVSEAMKSVGRSIQTELIAPIQEKAMPAINKFVQGFRDNLPAIRDAVGGAFSYITSAISKFAPTFESLFTIFKNVGGWVGSVLIVAFTGLASVLAPILNPLTSIVAKFTEWEGFAPLITGVTVAIGTYMAVTKAGAVATKAMAVATQLWSKAQLLLNGAMALNPIGLVIALIAGLVTAFVLAYQKSETFRDIVNGTWEAIKSGAKIAYDFIVNGLKSAISWMGDMWDGFKGMLTSVWDWAKSFFSQWGVTILAVLAPFIGVPLLIYQNWEQIKGWLSGIWTSVVNTGKTIWNGFSSFFITLWQNIVGFVSPIIDSFISSIVTGFTAFKDRLMTIVSPLVTFFVNTWENIKLMVLSVIAVFLNLITGNFEGLKIGLAGIWQAIKNQTINAINLLKTSALAIFNALSNVIKTIFSTIQSFLSKTWQNIKNTVVSLITSLKNTAVNLFNSLKTGALNAFNSLKTGVKNAIENTKSTAVNLFNALKTGALNAVNNLRTGAVNAFNNLRSSFTSIVTNIKNAVTNGFTNAKNSAISAITGMRDRISSTINSIKDKFSEMKNDIISKVKSIDLMQIGKDIVQGLINGISNKIGALKNKMTELADGVTGKVKDLLGIHSPSRVFREIGLFLGEGLSIGIDRSRKWVEKSSELLTKSAEIEPETPEYDPEGLPVDYGDNDGEGQGGGSGGSSGGVETNYNAPLMNIENYYQNDETDARNLSNGLYNLQQDHNRARGRKTRELR